MSTSSASTFTSSVLTVEQDGHVAVLWLDSPERRNAMGPDFWTDLPLAMEALSEDDDVRAVVVAAKGPHFSVGLDLKTMALSGGGSPNGPKPSPAAKASRFLRQVKKLQGAVSAVAGCPKPVVAAVHGACIGGAVDLITACDIRLASAEAFFSVRETKIAIVADVGTLQRLPRIIGRGHVAELAYTGKDITAERAAQIGLVNEVLGDPAALHKAALALAAEIAANSPLAVMGTKAVLTACANRTVEEGLDYVGVWNAAFLESDDVTEALAAFVEKRPATFTGR
jgi:enoyl-CoA hydratase